MEQIKKENIFSISSLTVAVISWSAFPFLLGVADTSNYNLSFMHFILTSCLCLGIIATSFIFYSKEYRDPIFWKTARETNIFSKKTFPQLKDRIFYILVIGSCCNLALAFIASRYAGGIVAGVGYETWVIWFVMMRCARKNNGKHVYLAAFSLMSLFGVGLVYAGQTGIWNIGSIPAVMLSVLSGFLGAVVMEGSIRWAEKATEHHPENIKGDSCVAYSQMACLAVTGVATLGGFIWLIADGISNTINSDGVALLILLGVFTGIASAAVRMGNKHERHLPLNIGLSLQIPLGILWIWLFLASVIASVWVFLIGITIIIMSVSLARAVDIKMTRKTEWNIEKPVQPLSDISAYK